MRWVGFATFLWEMNADKF